MYSRGPPIASGYRGSKKNATLEDCIQMNHNITTRKSNATFRYNTNLGRTTRVATNTTNNLRSYFTPVLRASQGEGSHDNKGHRRDNYTSARSRHSHCGSTWADSKASCKFCAQSTQFDTGTKSFRERSRPSASQLKASIHKESWSAKLRNNRSQLATSAYQISIHEQAAQNQILQLGDFMVKSDDCICLIMENFNSLGIFTNGTKINSLNNSVDNSTPTFWLAARPRRIGAKLRKSNNSETSLVLVWRQGASSPTTSMNVCNEISMAVVR